jgi:predicted transcriptional regulator
VEEHRLKEIQKILGDRSEIIGIFKETQKSKEHDVDGHAILALLQRRAMTTRQMTESLAMKQEEIIASLNDLLQTKMIRTYRFNGEEYYQAE